MYCKLISILTCRKANYLQKIEVSQLFATLLFLFIFGILVVIAHLLYKAKVSAENSRKFLHVSGGILSLFLPYFINSHWWVLVICTLAFLLLFVTWLRDQLPSVHKTKRPSLGSLFFPVPIYICFLVAAINNNNLLFYIPVSLLTFSDTVAEWGGRRWGKYSASFFNKQKTLVGSICFAASALLVTLLWLRIAFNVPATKSIEISCVVTIVATIAEAVSLRGFDNLSVPGTALAALYAMV